MDLLDNIATELGFEFHLYIVRDQLFGSKQRSRRDFLNAKQTVMHDKKVATDGSSGSGGGSRSDGYKSTTAATTTSTQTSTTTTSTTSTASDSMGHGTMNGQHHHNPYDGSDGMAYEYDNMQYIVVVLFDSNRHNANICLVQHSIIIAIVI